MRKGEMIMANLHPEFDERGRFKKRTELLPIQHQMICELVSGSNKAEACRKLEVSRKTLYNWLDNDLFMDEYRKACERAYKLILGKALNKLDKFMEVDDKRTALKACEDVLKLNNYLGSNINVNENTNETITIRLIDDEEESDNED